MDAETWGPDFSSEFCSFLDAEIWGPDFSIVFLALVGSLGDDEEVWKAHG